MIVKKRKLAAGITWCSNRWDGCADPVGAPRSATHTATLIGYDIPLCSACAKSMAAAYDSAIHPASWERALCL